MSKMTSKFNVLQVIMTNFSFYNTSKNTKIRYLKNISKSKTYIVFLHGFMSDLEGKKPSSFLKLAKKIKLDF